MTDKMTYRQVVGSSQLHTGWAAIMAGRHDIVAGDEGEAKRTNHPGGE